MAEEENICRFCFDKEESENPLIDPCKCTGSMKYVHVQCIQQWRSHTINREWMYKCQLCLSDFAIYLRWRKEQMPYITPLLQFLVDKHYIVSILFYYIHLTILSFYPSIYSNFMSINVLNPFEVNAFTDLQYLYFTQLSYYTYLVLLGITTCIYLKTYYNSFWKHIYNKQMYASFWLSCITDDGLFETPLMTVFMFILSAVLSIKYIFPFLFLYVYILSTICYIHMTIIRRMNADAEIF
jgi:hypothetical protein